MRPLCAYFLRQCHYSQSCLGSASIVCGRSKFAFGLSARARYWIGGTMLVGAFLGLGFYSVLLFRRTGQSENPWKPTTQIVNCGPFRFTRNPMYLQMVLGCIGFAIILANVWILLLTPLGAWVLQRFAILPEEAYLEAQVWREVSVVQTQSTPLALGNPS